MCTRTPKHEDRNSRIQNINLKTIFLKFMQIVLVDNLSKFGGKILTVKHLFLFLDDNIFFLGGGHLRCRFLNSVQNKLPLSEVKVFF